MSDEVSNNSPAETTTEIVENAQDESANENASEELPKDTENVSEELPKERESVPEELPKESNGVVENNDKAAPVPNKIVKTVASILLRVKEDTEMSSEEKIDTLSMLLGKFVEENGV